MTTAAPIPEHIQKLIDERAQVASEAAQLEWKAREKRVKVRELSERIEKEMRDHTQGGVNLLKILLTPPSPEHYPAEPEKRSRTGAQPKKATAPRKTDDERARLIAAAAEKGDWAEVARLSTAKL